MLHLYQGGLLRRPLISLTVKVHKAFGGAASVQPVGDATSAIWEVR